LGFFDLIEGLDLLLVQDWVGLKSSPASADGYLDVVERLPAVVPLAQST
jgi:hypothetical protein